MVDDAKAILILIVIIIAGIIVMFHGHIIPYLKNRKEIREKGEIRELIKNSLAGKC